MSFERIPLLLGLLATAAFILVNLAIRPSIDWDAVNYYLYVAVGFTNMHHVGMTLPTSIIITPHTPNGITPLLPTLYALAIEVAPTLHSTAEAAVHFIPFAFFAGTIIAARRLAGQFLPPIASDAAALFVAIMPAMLNYFVGNPLYVDGATVFLLTALANELFQLGSDFAQGARIGALVTLLILSKANGFVLVGFIIAIGAAGLLPKRWGRTVITILALAMIAGAAILKEYAAVSSIGLWIAIPITALICVACVDKLPENRGSLGPEGFWAIVFALPGAFYMYALTKAAGSPTGFFMPSLIHVHTPNYKWALSALRLGALYSVAQMPGLPQNYALGLLLWWGFSPFINLLAIGGAVFAFYRMRELRPLLLLVSIFYLAWLTVFNLTSFRHLLPVLPLLCIFAAAGLWKTVRAREHALTWSALLVVVCSVPFTWIAQQGMYIAPVAWLQSMSMDQYHALSGAALFWTALFVGSVFASAILIIRNRQRLEALLQMLEVIALGCFVSSAGLALFNQTAGSCAAAILGIALIIAAYLRRTGRTAAAERWVLPLAAVLAIAAVFEPMIAAAFSPGLLQQSATVRNNQDFGYIPTLDRTMSLRDGSGSILTYQGYGITWFSVGQFRRVDLTDAFDLGAIRTALQTQDATAFLSRMQSLDAFAAIVPAARDDSTYLSFRRMIARANLPALYTLFDPALTAAVDSTTDSWWEIRELLPLTTAKPSAATLTAVNGRQGDGLEVAMTRVAPAGATVTVFSTLEDEEKQAIAHFRFHAPISGAHFTIAPSEIVKQANLDSHNLTILRFVRIDAVIANLDPKQGVLDWRTLRSTFSERGNSWYLRSRPQFYLHPEASPIGYMLFNMPNDETGGFLAFPGVLPNVGSSPIKSIDIGLRQSAYCPAGSPLSIRVQGQRGSVTVSGVAGGEASIPARMLFARAAIRDRVRIEAVEARGVDAGCSVFERIEAHGLTLYDKHGEYVVGNFDRPHISELTVP